MPFTPGESGNPSGWQGGRQRRHREVFDEIKKLGHRDALITLSQIQHETQDVSLKIAAAAALAPYCHPKMQSTPTPRFIDLQIEVPEFTHVSDAENFLAKIALIVARGHLDIQSGHELSALVKTWIDTQYAKDELQFKINPPEQHDQVIKIQGGLPQLPGCENLIMPVINGHAVNEQLLTAPTDVVPQIESSGTNSTNPPETQDQGPA